MGNDVYVVMDGNKVGGVYVYREDAQAHATAIGGNMITQPIRREVPGWVQTMVDSAKEKARMQNPVRR